jgi:hypothetical protein
MEPLYPFLFANTKPLLFSLASFLLFLLFMFWQDFDDDR